MHSGENVGRLLEAQVYSWTDSSLKIHKAFQPCVHVVVLTGSCTVLNLLPYRCEVLQHLCGLIKTTSIQSNTSIKRPPLQIPQVRFSLA